MPCYEVNLISQKFQAKHLDILKESAKYMGMNFYQYPNQNILIGDMTIDLKKETIMGPDLYSINWLKRTYTELGMKKFAKKFGWQTQKKKENQFILQKF